MGKWLAEGRKRDTAGLWKRILDLYRNGIYAILSVGKNNNSNEKKKIFVCFPPSLLACFSPSVLLAFTHCILA